MTWAQIIELVLGLVIGAAKAAGTSDEDIDTAIARVRPARVAKVTADRAEEEGLFTMSSTAASPIVAPDGTRGPVIK